MTEKTELQMLGDETRPFFEKFWGVIAPYQNELWNYCKKIAGNPWDGEDLFQDTILNMFTSLSSLSHRSQPIHPRFFCFELPPTTGLTFAENEKCFSRNGQRT
jgi:RNA polymerase sigma-70 factor (ECF subfamily)